MIHITLTKCATGTTLIRGRSSANAILHLDKSDLANRQFNKLFGKTIESLASFILKKSYMDVAGFVIVRESLLWGDRIYHVGRIIDTEETMNIERVTVIFEDGCTGCFTPDEILYLPSHSRHFGSCNRKIPH